VLDVREEAASITARSSKEEAKDERKTCVGGSSPETGVEVWREKKSF
jgi:hypothetical protein